MRLLYNLLTYLLLIPFLVYWVIRGLGNRAYFNGLGNRFGFGVGLSPWPEDFQVTGSDWKTRGKRMDEMIEIIRGLTRGGYYAFRGQFYDFERIKISPVPTQPIPILIGGHSDAALRRAARLGDGWMHAGGGQASDLDAQLAEPFEIHVISMEAHSLDGIKRLEDRGITDCVVGFRNAYEPDTMPLQQKLDSIKSFADKVIARSRA